MAHAAQHRPFAHRAELGFHSEFIAHPSLAIGIAAFPDFRRDKLRLCFFSCTQGVAFLSDVGSVIPEKRQPEYYITLDSGK